MYVICISTLFLSPILYRGFSLFTCPSFKAVQHWLFSLVVAYISLSQQEVTKVVYLLFRIFIQVCIMIHEAHLYATQVLYICWIPLSVSSDTAMHHVHIKTELLI